MERKFRSLPLLLALFLLLEASPRAAASKATTELQPYCHENVTRVVTTPVIRTRTVVQRPQGTFKFLKKTKTYTEEYVADEETVVWKLETRCCDGFQMTPLKLCEPVCALGCPRHARCAAPGQCECDAGYVSGVSPIDASHYCEPVCAAGCPTNGRCAEPNVCECERGFHVDADGRHCVERSPQDSSDSHDSPTPTTTTTATTSGHGSTSPSDTNNAQRTTSATPTPRSAGFGSAEAPEGFPDDSALDESERIVVGPTVAPEATKPSESEVAKANSSESEATKTNSSESKTPPMTNENPTTSTERRCPDGAIYYHGECRPELFPSDEHDCRLRGCGADANARCHTNGSCVCADGYGWQPASDGGRVCLRRGEGGEPMAAGGEELEAEAEGAWLGAALAALGLGCIAGALLFLTVRLLRQQRGKLDVEGKSDLCCEYENKSFCESQMVH